jgi:hypothetical protein
VSRFDAAKPRAGSGLDRPLLEPIGKRLWHTPQMGRMIPLGFVVEEKDAQLGLAETQGVVQQSVEHVVQVFRRASDDLEYFANRLLCSSCGCKLLTKLIYGSRRNAFVRLVQHGPSTMRRWSAEGKVARPGTNRAELPKASKLIDALRKKTGAALTPRGGQKHGCAPSCSTSICRRS